ncbi:MAG: MazG family protein [Candidatus Dormibacteria bacterium]
MTDEELAQLRGLFEVMERLRAPGGCPWDRAQTHRSLLPFLLEETYEAIQAIEEGAPAGVAEELGDLLVEVAMHCAIAAQAGQFGIGEVAERARVKMVGRHPHVFSPGGEADLDSVVRNWEDLKREEKPHRASRLDGIPTALPALALAAAVLRRSSQGEPPSAGAAASALRLELEALEAAPADPARTERSLGSLLLAAVALARAHDVDAEAALRRAATSLRARRRQEELAGLAAAVEGGPNSG